MLDILALPILAATGYALRRRARAAAAGRAGMLRPCGALLAEAVHGRDRTGFGTLTGRFAGLPVVVRLIPEAVAFRRLPQLWLSVSVHRRTGFGATIDILRRVAGVEFYAPAADLPARYDVPDGWPGETVVRGSHGAGSLLAAVGPSVSAILAEPQVKEVLLTPRGVRIVRQVCEGERGAYLLLRENRFALTAVDEEVLRPLLARAAALGRLIPEDMTHDAMARHAA